VVRGVWLCVALAACLDPTEVTIELSSDACDQLGSIDILLGDATADVATAACPSNGRIGTLVFVPSERGRKFLVTAKGCDKAQTHCIRASRSVRFVSHTPLKLPISLDRACMDVLCQPDFTCSGGACVPEDVSDHCIGGVCTPTTPPDAGSPSCTPPWINPPPAKSFVWHFDSPTTVDQFGLCAPTTAIDIGPGMGTCNTAAFEKAYDGGGSMAQVLGCRPAGSGKSVHAAFWFRAGSPGSYLLQKIDPNLVSGWAIAIGTGGFSFRAADPMFGDNTLTFGAVPANGTWHSLELDASGGNATVWLDKAVIFMGSGAHVGATPNQDVIIGPLQGGAVDELYIYP